MNNDGISSNGSDSKATLSTRVQSLRLDGIGQTGGVRMSGSTRWIMVALGLGLAFFIFRDFSNRSQTGTKPEDDLSKAVQPAASNTSNSTTSSTASTTSNEKSTGPTSTAVGDVVLESKGYIIPAHQILVSPKVGGMVTKLYVEEGMRVKKGQVLAELEATEYQAEAQRSEGVLASAQQRLLELERGNRPEEIQQAEAELSEATAQREQLLSEWQRNQRLRPTRSLADHDYEVAESSYKAQNSRVERLKAALSLMKEGPRKERIEIARAEVKQSEADVIKAKWRLDNTKVIAPISGTILTKKAEEGNLVNSMAMNGSFSLVEMADLSDLEVDLTIQERDVSRVFKGQKCRIRSEAYPERYYEGQVSRLMPIADRAKGAVPVRVKVVVAADEEGVYLKPDMGVIVSFLGEKAKPAQ